MVGEWFALYNPTVGYIVARVRNIQEVVHSGNLEYRGGYMDNKAECERIADELNCKEDNDLGRGN